MKSAIFGDLNVNFHRDTELEVHQFVLTGKWLVQVRRLLPEVQPGKFLPNSNLVDLTGQLFDSLGFGAWLFFLAEMRASSARKLGCPG